MAVPPSGPDDKRNPKPQDGSDIPEWLRTDDWLQVTPTPSELASQMASPEEIIEIVDTDDDDAMLFTDMLPIGPTSGILASANQPKTVEEFLKPVSDPPSVGELLLNVADDDAIDLSDFADAPRFGPSTSVIRTGAQIVPDSDDVIGGNIPTLPATPGSGWLASTTKLSAPVPLTPPKSLSKPKLLLPSSTADIDLPIEPNDEASDIFSTARREDFTKSGATGATGSGLYTGAMAPDGVGPERIQPIPVGDSNLFGGGQDVDDSQMFDHDLGGFPLDFSPPSDERIEMAEPVFDSGIDFRIAVKPAAGWGSVSDADKLQAIRQDAIENRSLTEAELDLIGGDGLPDFNVTAIGQSGSNLLGDRTITDMELFDDLPTGQSGINLSDPEGDSAEDEARSSIFGKINDSQASGGRDAGHVDLDQIPLMGSSDDRTDAMFFEGDLASSPVVFGQKRKGAASPMDLTDEDQDSVFAMPPNRGGVPDSGDSGMIDWSSEPDKITNRLGGTSDIGQKTISTPITDDDEFDSLVASSRTKSSPPIDLDPDDDLLYEDNIHDGSAAMAAAGVALPASKAAKRTPSSVSSKYDTKFEDDEEPKTRKRGGALVGALGLLAGVGLGAGGMFFAAGGGAGTGTPVASNPPPPITSKANPEVVPPAATVAMAKSLLTGGDPVAALKAFEQAGADTTEVQAGRGQARWQARVRTADGKLDANDPELVKAVADLNAVYNAPDLKTPAEQAMGAKAALNLGLIQEITGKPKDAVATYEAAGKKFAGFKKVFDSAKRRITVMSKKADGTAVSDADFSRFMPHDEAFEIATASSIAFDFPPVQELDDEAGFHFWDAINSAANWQDPKSFDNAIASINKARAAHDVRRKKLAGMGLNPLSDPREQLFLRACDELRFYWTFKKQIYSDPTGMELARKSGTSGALAAMLKAVKDGGSQTKLEEATVLASKLSDDLKVAQKKASDDAAAYGIQAKKLDEDKLALLAEKKKADDANAKLLTAIETSKKDIDEKTALLETAKLALAKSGDKLKAADAALDPLLEKLKAAKLIDEKEPREKVIAALPELAKKVVLLSGTTGETAELAKQLTDARAEMKKSQEVATKAVKDAETNLLAARKDSDKSIAEMQAKLKDTEAKVAIDVKKAADETRAEMQKKLDATMLTSSERQKQSEAELKKANDERTLEAKAAEIKLASQAEQFRGQIAAVRAGVIVPLSEPERATADLANTSYLAGVEAFFAGRNSDAETSLAKAVAANGTDARYWYFLGLSKWSQGRTTEADADFKKGAEWESRAKPGRRQVGLALERVQGNARQALEVHRP